MSLIDRLELAKQAKVANQQMRRLEKAGCTRSPAYKAAQSYLTALGVKPTASGARRFPESYKSVSEEMLRAYQKGVAGLREPDNATGFNLGTVSGVRSYYKAVYQAADATYHLQESGIGQEEYLKFWEEMPDKEKQRVYGSRVYIRILRAYSTKYGDSGKYSAAEIAKKVNSANSFLAALDDIGLTAGEYAKFGYAEGAPTGSGRKRGKVPEGKKRKPGRKKSKRNPGRKGGKKK